MNSLGFQYPKLLIVEECDFGACDFETRNVDRLSLATTHLTHLAAACKINLQ